MAGIFGATGETRVAGSRLLVQRSVYNEVASRLAVRAEQIKLATRRPRHGNGTAANEPQFNRIMKMIEDAKTGGATLATGGKAAKSPGLPSLGIFHRAHDFHRCLPTT